jgi:protein-S-isoprenylcysteine O-methyltransferase Ste14
VGKWSAIARRIRVPLGFAVAVIYLWLASPSTLSIELGAVLVIAGLVFRGWASGHLRKNEQLATTGPYAYTRNPLYLGSAILAVGFAVAARSWWIAGILAVMFVAIYLPVIRAEEEYLAQNFPEFPAYADRVPRLLPELKAIGENDARFSWRLYKKHREYHATLGAVALMAVLAGKLLWISR